MKLNSSLRFVRFQRGFTLIEMVLVLAVIALLIGAGVTHLIGVRGITQDRTGMMKLSGLQSALELYSLGAGRYPTQEQGLQALLRRPGKEPIPKSWAQQVKSRESLIDTFGNPFHYRAPGRDGAPYDLYSLGHDGVESADDLRLD